MAGQRWSADSTVASSINGSALPAVPAPTPTRGGPPTLANRPCPLGVEQSTRGRRIEAVQD